MNAVEKTKFCQGISDISDSYMGFIIDQWGVLHDGKKPYDGAIETLKELKSRGKHVIILSNSGKRAEENKERLKKIGIGPSLYNEILSSGEMAWQGMEKQDDEIFKGLGNKCYLISRGNDRSIVDGLGLEIVEDANDATFLLIAGADSPEKTLKDYEPALKICARKQLKAICANPDSRGIMGRDYIMGPGTLAARYRDFGGVVHYIGKPHQPIFKRCIKTLQDKGIYPGQTVMIGDSMAHDIMGAHLVNIDSVLVKAGLHAGAFLGVNSVKDAEIALSNLCGQYNNIRPNYLVHTVKWGTPLPDRKHKKRDV